MGQCRTVLVPLVRTARPANLELAERARAAATGNDRTVPISPVKRVPRERLERVDCVRRPVPLAKLPMQVEHFATTVLPGKRVLLAFAIVVLQANMLRPVIRCVPIAL